ncbi:carbon-nitrogen hydrolase family protein [Caldinitratiruptor microaerophilus]|uniref:CN hydrolase domain-containing protein n=1 Tax=Caldinitratiruptor microaerophilus TaxID=671077 RepID=A0AA35CPB5_9FIRM|nr:carbon-nitrogen hydrolase family protein [Caldinitratiruptor microaerophilus]BDG61211.1 hypothetical protein caldi_23010 [Caldinitratiruptor microaerophilus]
MRVRIAAVQFAHRPLNDFEEFARQVRTDVTLARDYDSQLVVFPEYLTGALLTIPGSGEGMAAWHRWTGPYVDLFSSLARETGTWILAGTHLTPQGERTTNTAHLFDPAGGVHTQSKLHLTPCEVDPWELAAGEAVHVFDTPLGRLAVLVCYDIEFPEAARAAAEAGADILLCPAATDDRSGYWRVRYSCHARAVENQVFVVLAPLVGGAHVRFLEQGYGRAAILSPCDVPFPRDGVVAEGEWNQHLVVIGDVDLGLLAEIRERGSVTPRLSRRPEYRCVPVKIDGLQAVR